MTGALKDNLNAGEDFKCWCGRIQWQCSKCGKISPIVSHSAYYLGKYEDWIDELLAKIGWRKINHWGYVERDGEHLANFPEYFCEKCK